MKKNFKTLLMLGIVASVGFTACEKDEETTPTPNPTTYGQVNTFSAKMMGGQNNATLGSFLATDNGEVITSSAAGASATVQARVDLVYFFGTTNQASMGAPNDSVVAIAHTGSTSLPTWTTKNATKFVKTSITAADFSASANDSLVKTVDAATISGSFVNTLAVGNVVAFKTASGKLGLFHVQSVDGTTGTDRSITINVKVQK
jgi:hypothetical protein